MENDFVYGMKVSLDNEFGVVIREKSDDSNLIGVICWDSPQKNNTEDWRGQFGTFIRIGGKILDSEYVFQFINDDGSFKNS
ncbi:hypothetical protein K6T82_09155 [Flavobacterium sp. 17A]|uniref:Uncharacterized protein n=1 Tax=Flavobacterium potami TaxID=2872310 RepID=A0A9X1H915_9FLAO|nr:hypothetical protein [Flavobacterium potami]MBZ4034934.1 hypothetical protein [Flavobacterium potami]